MDEFNYLQFLNDDEQLLQAELKINFSEILFHLSVQMLIIILEKFLYRLPKKLRAEYRKTERNEENITTNSTLLDEML